MSNQSSGKSTDGNNAIRTILSTFRNLYMYFADDMWVLIGAGGKTVGQLRIVVMKKD